jgi:hypothetical protein
MKYAALTLAAVSMIALSSAAKADTYDQITTSDIHNFLMRINASMNNPNPFVGSGFLNASISNNAVFEDRLAIYAPAPMAYNVYYSQPYYAGYYRYPVYSGISQVSMRTMNKADQIALFEAKKHDIAGYWSDISLTDAAIRPYGRSAVIDVDVKEYSLGYAPLNPNLASRVMHANSKCKMYLGKSNEQVFISRMDCNVNTSMPF